MRAAGAGSAGEPACSGLGAWTGAGGALAGGLAGRGGGDALAPPR
jgi:hypothetical protein